MITHNCPDCGAKCTPWATPQGTLYIECQNKDCRRHTITVTVEHWLVLTEAEITSHNESHVSYAVAKAREAARKAAKS